MSGEALSAGRERMLRYWSANMTMLEDMGAGWWPGFTAASSLKLEISVANMRPTAFERAAFI